MSTGAASPAMDYFPEARIAATLPNPPHLGVPFQKAAIAIER